MAIINTPSSYLDMDKELTARINCITPNSLTISQTIYTIKQMYFNGTNDMDSKWRKALKLFAKKYKMKYTPGILDELITVLNNI